MTHRFNAVRPSGVRLVATGLAVPDRVVTNDELAKKIDTTDEWIRKRTGITQRYLVDENTTEVDLAKQALGNAIKQAEIAPSELDMVLCATMTSQMCCPSTAARLVAEVNAVPAGAMDLSAACSGFVYGMNLASSLIESGHHKMVAVVGTEVLSRMVDWNDRRTCVLFGDGAGAAIFSASPDPNQGCLHQILASNGGQWQQLYVPQDQSHVPNNSSFNGTFNTLQMNGKEVYKFAVTTLEQTIEKVLSQCELKMSDLAMIIPHQSNQRILESVRDRLEIPPDKLYINIDRYGNTSAASVPICLHELMTASRLKSGDLVLFVALGGGLTWASSLWRL